jgi:Mlc titration factor MtfA (ptsG expression regulator)
MFFVFPMFIVIFLVAKHLISNHKLWKAEIAPPLEFILQSKTSFYKMLPSEIKKRFRHRLAIFMDAHEFEGREGLILTEEMKLMISAAAIHLTLGLNDYTLGDFRKIFVYPDVYYSGYSKTTNRGETNPHGIIALTWRYVEEGFADVSDKMNLGYHEFAHALMLQHVNGSLNDETFSFGYQKFCYMLQKEHLAKHVEEAGFLRDYAFTNKMEFFAASAEYFLEAPQEMYEHSKELFYLMVRMLRQDPTHQYYDLTFNYNPEDEMFLTEY